MWMQWMHTVGRHSITVIPNLLTMTPSLRIPSSLPAANGGQLDVAIELLERGAKVVQASDATTPMLYLARTRVVVENHTK